MRFVVLEHRFVDSSHWDLLFEVPMGQLLKSFSVHDYPLGLAWRPARALAPHRAIYLDYQGPVLSAGGSVRRRERGRHAILAAEPNLFRTIVHGGAMKGILEFIGPGEDQEDGWTCRFQLALGE